MNTPAAPLTGRALPEVRTVIPGPRSIELAARLRKYESPNITSIAPAPPIFWAEARGANVRDVDDNIYVDLTAGFGVANAGYAHPRVVEAIAQQAARLPHALGDVYPAEIKVQLLEKLAQIMPGDLRVGILANSGSEAVEAALKTAVMRTGKTGIIAFGDAYHGLTYGALATTQRAHFREPFERQLYQGVHFARFPRAGENIEDVMREIDELIATNDIGAIIVEPIQGRGGIVMPADGFLAGLRARCDGTTRVLIFDEIYTGCGRTGKWLACEHWNVLPDVVAIGKGLSGALPISACLGTDAVMSAWPPSTGEAIHTSTFLGNPIACAAALAQIETIEREQLMQRATLIGNRIERWADEMKLHRRGMGLIQGIVLASPGDAIEVCAHALQQGILLIAEGAETNVLAITPPAVISDEQISFALERIGAILARA